MTTREAVREVLGNLHYAMLPRTELVAAFRAFLARLDAEEAAAKELSLDSDVDNRFAGSNTVAALARLDAGAQVFNQIPTTPLKGSQ